MCLSFLVGRYILLFIVRIWWNSASILQSFQIWQDYFLNFSNIIQKQKLKEVVIKFKITVIYILKKKNISDSNQKSK